ncbi:ALF repeat-containing protein [Streptomyces atratus]|uniref:ALF repeat-containing protein n=1 Tax=Streptomyces atratus TaxID=1893 RepID=UPI0037AAD51E
MRPTRAALLVAATALTPALLFTTPAFATGSTATSTTVTATSETPVDEMSEEDDRVAVFRILYLAQQNGDQAIIREANKALNDGSPEALRTFLETGYRIAQAEDDSVAIFRILYLAQQNGDQAVIREVNKALNDGSPEALRTFLETGYRIAQAEDDRVAIFRILADPTISNALRAAAEEAIDGTPEELRYFLEVGQYKVDG